MLISGAIDGADLQEYLLKILNYQLLCELAPVLDGKLTRRCCRKIYWVWIVGAADRDRWGIFILGERQNCRDGRIGQIYWLIVCISK